jgi:pyrroline-5-carboxylate reductase
MTLAFIGGGNMASALIGGLIARGAKPASICVVEPVPAARRRVAAKFKVRASAAADARVLAADTLVLAVKPQDMRLAATPLAGKLGGKLVISVAAGIRLKDLSRWLGGHAKLVRCMPNTPALIGAGIAGLYAPAGVKPLERRRAERILGAVGKVVWVKDEALLDPVTAVSGSGPAYVFLLIECLAEAGRQAGLPADLAGRLARATVIGSGELARLSDESAAKLRQAVTSPGGTTAAALEVLMGEDGLQQLMVKAVAAATRRSRELAG